MPEKRPVRLRIWVWHMVEFLIKVVNSDERGNDIR
jgi:hypothetical protein